MKKTQRRKFLNSLETVMFGSEGAMILPKVHVALCLVLGGKNDLSVSFLRYIGLILEFCFFLKTLRLSFPKLPSAQCNKKSE